MERISVDGYCVHCDMWKHVLVFEGEEGVCVGCEIEHYGNEYGILSIIEHFGTM